jgi:hypothetical protein
MLWITSRRARQRTQTLEDMKDDAPIIATFTLHNNVRDNPFGVTKHSGNKLVIIQHVKLSGSKIVCCARDSRRQQQEHESTQNCPKDV